MADFSQQLAILRSKMAAIDHKYGSQPPRPTVAQRHFAEDLISGSVVETPAGKHFETEKLWERHRRHGSVGIADLEDLPDDFLDSLSDGCIPRSHPSKWCFLDTETTGLAGGTGTYAFLIGCGSIERDGFRVRQFFMRDYSEEASQLHALAEYLARFDVLITYNGKTYDQPLLETRYRMVRQRHPFSRMEHLDLLFGSRRLWKIRLDSCRLVHLENQILGVEREGDLPGELIPYYYFDYVRTQKAVKLVPILHHNVVDIVSLACLTAIVPEAFRSPSTIPVRHGSDLLGVARWLLRAERAHESLALLRRALNLGLPDAHLFRTMLEIGLLEKKLGNDAASVAMFTELAASPNLYQGRAYEELAKFYEHRERNYAMALEMTRLARNLNGTPELDRRIERLRARLARPKQGRLKAARRETGTLN
ncbi:MAG TPA: ribonuclease H-like domain-containing protein [Bryobacteraceae bacterium]